MVSCLILTHFDRLRFEHTTKTNCITFQIVDQKIYSILILASFSITFCVFLIEIGKPDRTGRIKMRMH